MDKKDLYALDSALYKQIRADREKKEAETKAYFDGVEKGVDLMVKAVRDFMNNEAQEATKGGVKDV